MQKLFNRPLPSPPSYRHAYRPLPSPPSYHPLQVGLCAVPPVGQPQALLGLTNSCAMADVLGALTARFDKLYRRRAHVHHFTQVARVHGTCMACARARARACARAWWASSHA